MIRQSMVLEAQVNESNAAKAKLQALADDLQDKIKATHEELEQEAKERRQVEERLKKKETECERWKQQSVSIEEEVKSALENVDNYNKQVRRQSCISSS